MTAPLCPDCRAERPPTSPACPRCGLPLTGPTATELGWVDRELVDLARTLTALDQEQSRLRARQGQLMSRRAQLIGALRAAARRPLPVGQPGGAFASAPVGAAREAAGVVRPATRTAGETSSLSIQTGLLALGGLLLAVAAIAFTVFAWGRFGIAGRALILAGLTAVMLIVPALLVRFTLRATGETIAAVGLVLVALDGYAAWHVGLFDVDARVPATAYAGIVAAVVTLVAAAYPALVPLRLPRPVAILTGQAVPPLLALAYQPGWLPFGTSFALLAAVDLGIVAWARRRSATPERVVAGCCAALTGLIAGSTAAAELARAAWTGGTGVIGLGPALLLIAAGGLGLAAAELAGRGVARQVAAGVAVLTVAAGGFGVHLGSIDGWPVSGGAVAALVVVALGAVAPAAWRVGALAGAAAVTAAATLVPALWTAIALAGVLEWASAPWSVPADEPARLTSGTGLAPGADLAVAVGVLAVAIALAVWRRLGVAALPYALGGPLVAATLLVPAALDAPLAVALLVEGVAALGFGAAAVALPGRSRRTALAVLGTVLGAHAALWSLASEPATLVTLGALAVGWAGLAAAWARLRPGQAPALGGLAAAAALLAVSGETAAAAVSLGAPRFTVALALFAAAVMATGVAALLPDTLPAYARAALVTVPLTASAGLLAGVPGADRPDVALLAALAGTVVAAGAVVARLTGSGTAAESGLTAVGALGLAAGALAVLPVVAQAVLAPYSWADAVWSGAPARSGAGLGADEGWAGAPFDVLALLLVAVGAALLGGQSGARLAARAGAPVAALAVLLVPLAADAPWVVGLGTVTLLAAAGAGLAATGIERLLGGAFAAVLGGTALAWSLAARPATVAVLWVVVGGGVTVGWFGRGRAARLAGTVVAAVAALVEAGVLGSAAGLTVPEVAYPVLATAAGVAAGAAVLRSRRPEQGVGLEFSAVLGAAAALALAAEVRWHSALVLTLTGVAVGLTALRPDRRPAAYAALGVEIAASWLWLAAADVRVPEAYTLPAALIAVAAGLLALYRRPALSSWSALAPGLAAAFLPSLALVFGGAGSPWRSLLLGAGALAVLIAGAASRRQAPFILGTLTVALVALREVWPLLPWVVSTVPTWVPLALGGALLVALGATYEQRRHDLRRARHVVGRMH